MMKNPVTPVTVTKVEEHSATLHDDLLAAEEPLELRLGFGKAGAREQIGLSVTMRTPGNDFEWALGFLFTEGIISSYQDVAAIHYCETVKPEEKGNVVRVELNEQVVLQLNKLQRNFYTTSSCGVCGKSSIDSVRVVSRFLPKTFSVSADLIHALPEKLSSGQTVFEHTGGLHAVAVFDLLGNVISVREDVGRHNAFDKIVGEALIKNQLPLSDRILLLSGRASFELVQKAVVAGAAMIVSVGAPSSLALSLAKEMNVTLIGFVRNRKFNIYHGGERVTALELK
jgi:FdhD protein